MSTARVPAELPAGRRQAVAYWHPEVRARMPLRARDNRDPLSAPAHESADTGFSQASRRLTTAIDAVLALVCTAVMVAWFAGRPIFYSDASPVTSWFTAFSVLIMVVIRQARLRLDTWPMALGLAMSGLVLGGNVSSMLILAVAPAELWAGIPDLVLTSVMTSLGLVLFCAYDFVVTLRETPRSAFIMDDLLIHLALVPGG